MRAWLAQDNNGWIFAYLNQPHFECENWWGDVFASLTTEELPKEIKEKLEQNRLVFVDLVIKVTSFRIIS